MKNPEHIAIHECYRWQIAFADGTVIAQGDLFQGEKVNPNRPPRELGEPVCISLIPCRPDLKAVSAPVPKGATPVYHRETLRQVTSLELASLAFRIGWRLNNVRNMIAVEAQSGHVSLVLDQVHGD